MDRKSLRPVGPLFFMGCISFFMVTRTEGFDNIRAVQILLLLVTGALIGLGIGILRGARAGRPTN
jgi:hypothetical protein